MTMLPLAGPSSELRASAAEVRRTVNWTAIRIESGTGRGGAATYLKQVPGLRLVGSVGGGVLALKEAKGRLYAATTVGLREIESDWSVVHRGDFIVTKAAMESNETQLAIVCGTVGYVFDTESNTLTPLSGNWQGSNTVSELDGYGIYVRPDTNQFYISNIQDFSSIDALLFASAESSPGFLVGTVVKRRELVLFKENSSEIWFDAGDATFPFARDSSAAIDTGAIAARSIKALNGVAYWLGRDEDGGAVVYALPGYSAVRVSSQALEEKLASLTELSGAWAMTYQQEGLDYYVLNVPGLETTWVLEVGSGLWTERAEWVSGAWQPWRATAHAYAFGQHVIGDAAGNIYVLDPIYNKNGSDPLRRNWISPHNSVPGGEVQRFSSFEVICDVAQNIDAGSSTLMLRYSNDGARNWEDWIYIPLGDTGETQQRVRETMLGASRDRVWEIAITDDTMCNLVSILVNEV